MALHENPAPRTLPSSGNRHMVSKDSKRNHKCHLSDLRSLKGPDGVRTTSRAARAAKSCVAIVLHQLDTENTAGRDSPGASVRSRAHLLLQVGMGMWADNFAQQTNVMRVR